jgi:hypothetical protein
MSKFLAVLLLVVITIALGIVIQSYLNGAIESILYSMF